MPRRIQRLEPAVNVQPAVVGAFGAYLRAELRARRWSIRSLAARSGVDHSTIVRLMGGYREPRLETVRRLQQALGYVGQDLILAISHAAATNDPVQRVADALGADPKLDRQGMATVVAYYLRLRKPPGPAPTASRRTTTVGSSRRRSKQSSPSGTFG